MRKANTLKEIESAAYTLNPMKRAARAHTLNPKRNSIDNWNGGVATRGKKHIGRASYRQGAAIEALFQRFKVCLEWIIKHCFHLSQSLQSQLSVHRYGFMQARKSEVSLFTEEDFFFPLFQLQDKEITLLRESTCNSERKPEKENWLKNATASAEMGREHVRSIFLSQGILNMVEREESIIQTPSDKSICA